MIPQKRITEFQTYIFHWWALNRRNLPWRETHDPYRILISEVMLQQTQVNRVLIKYQEFLSLFPTVEALAAASIADVLKAWKGMGYNRRALYLKKTAEVVVTLYGGRFPDDEVLLKKLPGLGNYTSRAILVFAYKKDTAMIDTNIRQIITHFFFDGLVQKEKDIQNIADALVPKGKSWEWHQALMDFGSLGLKQLGYSSKGLVKKQTPFKESKRFIRGRIMDRLREGEMKEFILVKEMVETHQKEPSYVEEIIEDLIKDGLLVKIPSEILRLPT